MRIDLEREDFETPLMMMGMALGLAARARDEAMAARYIRVANAVNANNPNWTPYEVPDDNHVRV
ncbi:MAG: hypothetical protein WBQ94_04305 [Terracidiphilus sp.]